MKHKLICERCGAEFEGRDKQKYCSKKCASMASQARCGGSENARLEREYCIEQAQRRQARLEMMERLKARDAAYAAAYPLLASGANRGTRFFGTFGKRETPTMVDVATHKEIIAFSAASKRIVAMKQKARTKDKGQKAKAKAKE